MLLLNVRSIKAVYSRKEAKDMTSDNLKMLANINILGYMDRQDMRTQVEENERLL